MRQIPYLISSIIGTNAFCYMILGRMIQFFVPDQKLVGVRARRFTLVFVLLDILCVICWAGSCTNTDFSASSFLVQGTGASLASDTDKDAAALKSIQNGVHICASITLVLSSLSHHIHCFQTRSVSAFSSSSFSSSSVSPSVSSGVCVPFPSTTARTRGSRCCSRCTPRSR
jgi:hypothetical protein